MASDDDVFWTYGDKRKKNRKAKAGNENEDADNNELEIVKKLSIGKSDAPKKLSTDLNSDGQENASKNTRLNPYGGGAVDFSQSQRFEKIEERQGNQQGVRFNQTANIQGNSSGKFSQNSSGLQQRNSNENNSGHYQENANYNFSFSPLKNSKGKNSKSGGFGLSQTVTSNFVFDSASPARSTLNNRKPFSASNKKINEFSPSVYDKINSSEFKFQRKGESIWDDLYNNAKAMLHKKMALHREKQNEEDKECVFMPQQYSNNNKYFAYENNKFLERNEQWKENRDNKLISQRQSKISIDLRECTFQPTINSHRIRTEIPREQEIDFVQGLGRAQDTNKVFSNQRSKEVSPNRQEQIGGYLNSNRNRKDGFYDEEQNGKGTARGYRDLSRPLSYQKTTYRDASASYQGKNQSNMSMLDSRAAGGIVKSYYIRERERFDKCKKMLSQALKKIPDENIL